MRLGFPKRKRLSRRERLEERVLKGKETVLLLPLAGLCFKDGEMEKALEYCKDFLEEHPDDAGGLYLMAKIKEAMDDVEGAIAVLEDMKVRFPCALGARKRLGRLYSRAGRDDEAIGEYLFVLSEFRDSHLKRLVERRSRKARELPDTKGAAEDEVEIEPAEVAEDEDLPVINLDEEIEIPEDGAPEDIDEEFLTLEMADMYYKQGMIPMAVEVLEKLHLQDPENEEVKKRLERLRPLMEMLEPEEP